MYKIIIKGASQFSMDKPPDRLSNPNWPVLNSCTYEQQEKGSVALHMYVHVYVYVYTYMYVYICIHLSIIDI